MQEITNIKAFGEFTDASITCLKYKPKSWLEFVYDLVHAMMYNTTIQNLKSIRSELIKKVKHLYFSAILKEFPGHQNCKKLYY